MQPYLKISLIIMQKYADKRLYKSSNEGKINEKDLFVEPSLKGTYEKPNTLKPLMGDTTEAKTAVEPS